jgi:hypothetical protein
MNALTSGALAALLCLVVATARAQAPEAAPVPDPGAATPATPVEGTAPDPAASRELTEAELRDLGLESVEVSAVDTSIKVSGFIDFGVSVALNDVMRELLEHPAMYIGNANIYLSKNITQSLRTMLEVRLLYLPNGSTVSAADPTEFRAVANDYNDFNRPLHWGGIELERIYLEWTAHRLLTIRLGQFLTPYGVWNVDHGSPTIIPANRPYVIGENWFPERQTGFEFYGRSNLGNLSAIGYHLTFSNGDGPFTEYKDLDGNKAIGARAYWEYRRLGELRVGGSFYYGRTTDSESTLNLDPDGPLTKRKINIQYDQLAFGFDAVWKYRGVHLQSEVLTRQQRFTDAGRTALFSIADFSTGYPTDTIGWGGYVLAGYRFEWFGVMPYVMVQRLDALSYTLRAMNEGTSYNIGLNVRPVDALALKVEYAYGDFDASTPFPRGDLQIFSAQAAWAF